MESFTFSLYNGVFGLAFFWSFFLGKEKISRLEFLVLGILSIGVFLASWGIYTINFPTWLGPFVFLLIMATFLRGYNDTVIVVLLLNMVYSFLPIGLIIVGFKDPMANIDKMAEVIFVYWGKFQVLTLVLILSLLFLAYAERELVAITREWRWRRKF